MDEIEDSILLFINGSIRNEPFCITEILENVKSKMQTTTRAMIFYRLVKLRGEKKIYGKLLGGKKGTWVYWKKRNRSRRKTPTEPETFKS